MSGQAFAQEMNHQMTQLYSIPEGIRVYAIGDVHGHLEALKDMQAQIEADLARAPVDEAHIVYLGDYVDRGPQSREVIEFLIELEACKDGIRKTFLAGNHEVAIYGFMKDPVGHDWLRYGGLETLNSYGVTFLGGLPLPSEIEGIPKMMAKSIPKAHFDFFMRLDFEVSIGDYMFVHAGVDPRIDLGKQPRRALTGIREPFLSWHEHEDYKPLKKRIVHGHTISVEVEALPHRINVDTGLYDGGPLSAAVLEGIDVRFLQVFD